MRNLFFLWLSLSASLAAQNPVDWVDLFIATAGDHGQNDPSATVPYGMVKVSPDTDPANHGGYDYESTRLAGFSVNRVCGTGCSGAGGHLRILPRTGDAASYVFLHKGTEEARPGYYAVELSNGVRVELTATNNLAVERYYFGKNESFVLELNPRSSFSELIKSDCKPLPPKALCGEYQAKNNCDLGRYIQYYYLESSQPFEVGGKDRVEMKFVKKDAPFVEVRIALSGIDSATARKECESQAGLTFEAIRTEAAGKWAAKLNRITLRGASEGELKMFYTSFYRTFLSPVNVTSGQGEYRDTKGALRKADGFTYMSSWSLWDTYRTKFPLLSLMDAAAYADICRSLTEVYRSGRDPSASEYESTPTCRNEHSLILLLDAYRKGFRGFDLHSVYGQMEQEAAALPMQSPDQFLESAYDLWALAHISKELKKTEKHAYYKAKSDSVWRSKWIEKFRDIDEATFDVMHGDGLYEGTLWQYRWAIPFAIEEAAELAGGQEKLADELSQFFSRHLYNHGNQPDIHAALLFNRLARPDLAQQWVTAILTESMIHPYGTHNKFPTPFAGKTYRPLPDGFIPEMDDDDATMSAWYVWTAMGLYPLVVGEPYYEIVRPLFDEITLKLDGGKVFTIRNKSSETVRKITLNGKTIHDFRIRHQDICAGGTLEIF
ncbi:MAG: glycoside hydrolase family 92 protein [Tannerella sp.]|jgi:putative alpha-1,2-mannosidase|nr:glycoside hydrolase family 92 protein [Tannerella sp.]